MNTFVCRHSGESRNPAFWRVFWIPAFAGMTTGYLNLPDCKRTTT